MKEIALSDLQEWYLKTLRDRFKKEQKVLAKFFDMASREIAESKNSLNAWISSAKQPDEETGEKIDEKNLKIMERFILTVQDAMGEIKVPTIHNEISYETSQAFCDGVKKLYIVYNETGRKSIARFANQYSTEIKEIDLHLRRVGDLTNKIAEFLRNNYQDAKNAELVMKRIPRLQNDIERIGQTKVKIGDMEKELIQMKESLQKNETQLIQISQDPDLQLYEGLDHDEQIKSNELRDQLKFKKAIQKLKNALDKGNIVSRGLTENDIRPYLKDPIQTLLDQGPKVNNLKDMLVKLRFLLEEESDPLQLKGEVRDKILSNINDIVNKNELESNITLLLEIRQNKEKITKILESKGLESLRKDLKEKIASLTIEVEHFENDLNRRKREYRELLEKISSDREELHKAILNETGQQIKINIIIPA